MVNFREMILCVACSISRVLILTHVLSIGSSRKLARNQVVVPQTKATPSISIKDVIAVLEREPQMSKSTVMYRLYEKMRGDAVAE